MTDIRMCKMGVAVYAHLALNSGSPIFDMTKVSIRCMLWHSFEHFWTIFPLSYCCFFVVFVNFTMNGSWPLPSGDRDFWLFYLKRHVGHVRLCAHHLLVFGTFRHFLYPIPVPEVSDLHGFAMLPPLRAPRSLSRSTAGHAPASEQIAALPVAEDLLQRSRRRGCTGKIREGWMKIDLQQCFVCWIVKWFYLISKQTLGEGTAKLGRKKMVIPWYTIRIGGKTVKLLKHRKIDIASENGEGSLKQTN